MVTWRTKALYVALGVSIIFSGLSTFFRNLSNFAPAILLFFAGVLLIGQTAFKTLINGKFDDKDIVSGVTLVFGVLTIIGGILIMTSVTIPLWLGYLLPWVIGSVGLMIIIQGFRL